MTCAISLGLLAAAAGCQVGDTVGEPPVGRQLVAGRGLFNPAFTPHEERLVTYETPLPADGLPVAPPVDLHVVPYFGGSTTVMLANQSHDWGRVWDDDLALWAVRDQRASSMRGLSGEPTVVGTLARVNVAAEVTVEIPRVSNWALFAAGSLLYETIPPAAQQPMLAVRLADGRQADLGAATWNQIVAGGRVWFIRDAMPTLYMVTLPDPGAPIPTPVARLADVERMWVLPDARFLLVKRGDASGRGFALMEVGSGRVHKLVGDDVCCLLGATFSAPGGLVLHYAETRSATGLGRLHRASVAAGAVDVVDVVDTTYERPADDSSGAYVSLWTRPGGGDFLLADADGNLSLFQANAEPALVNLRRQALAPLFVDGGRFLVYAQRVVEDGAVVLSLVSVDATNLTAASEGHVLTPAGASVSDFFTLGGGKRLAFRAYRGDEFSDLYLADLDAGTSRVVARQVGALALNLDRIVGLVRVNRQDLVGELVQIDVASGTERRLAAAVSDFALGRACATCSALAPGALVAYVVQTRAPSAWDGLWAATLE